MTELVPGARTEEGEDGKRGKHRQISDDSQSHSARYLRAIREKKKTDRESE